MLLIFKSLFTDCCTFLLYTTKMGDIEKIFIYFYLKNKLFKNAYAFCTARSSSY